MSSALPLPSPAELLASESRAIQSEFEATGDGLTATRRRSELVDRVVRRLFQEFASPAPGGPQNFCLVAVGGYGRGELHPHSDVDLLFLFAENRDQECFREAVATIARTLWDLRLRVGHSVHALAECGELHRDNLEFNVSLLDCRCLAGDTRLFAALHDRVVPRLVARERQDLTSDLLEVTRVRHEKHGGTIFHLEPNIKEAPGGLRDYHVARWLARIAELERSGCWTVPEESWRAALRDPSRRACAFLSSTRCLLHYQRGRDDNQLAYELQDLAAASGIGEPRSPGAPQAVSAAEWMRAYFRHARSIDRLVTQMIDEASATRSSLYVQFQEWRSRLSNADFSVLKGRIFPRQASAAVKDAGPLLDLFEMVARHQLDLSREAERWVEEALARLTAGGEASPLSLPDLWPRFRQILLLPHPARALRVMHQLGLLDALFPEFRAIDALVTRDFYHRYTVDEHTFMTIQGLNDLAELERRSAKDSVHPADHDEIMTLWRMNFADILAELERPELLAFALLFHDVGKGMPCEDHARGSLDAVEGVFERLQLPAADRDTVRFLIAQHLEMSATLMRRDIFDPEAIREFSRVVGTPDRLKMLCLLTYADVNAVNPEALTPWKTEMLWRLYTATFNFLTRSVDDERVRAAEAEAAKTASVLALAGPSATERQLGAFLEGFPRRYLETHAPEDIAAHFAGALRLAVEAADASVRARGHVHELTVIARDRPFLFASLTGALTAWGMNILKADAFSNAAGVVLDTFRFVDLHRTLELNPTERARLERSVAGVLAGEVDLGALLRGRTAQPVRRAKIDIPTQIRFDDASSSHSTLVELITWDRPGLLYQVSKTLAELGCDIGVALIDTEGEKVIDVFYLTSEGTKLHPREQQRVREKLLSLLDLP